MAVETVTFTAPDISCGHCVMTIKEEVGALAGVADVQASEQTKQVTVQYDPSAVSTEQIVATLDEAGYPVAR